MSILIDFTLLCIGFYLLTKGADYFIDNSASFAEEKGISPHVAGVTIVAFGTSLPELLVSIMFGINHTKNILFRKLLHVFRDQVIYIIYLMITSG